MAQTKTVNYAHSIKAAVSIACIREYKRGKYHYTVDLLFDWFGISCMTTDNFCFYFQNRLIQTSRTGGQQYSDTSPFSIPCLHAYVIPYIATAGANVIKLFCP